MIAMLLALAPVAAFVLYIYVRDEYDREPIGLLFFCFLSGILSVIPAYYSSKYLASTGISISQNIFETFAYAFGVVALSEEFAKFLFLRIFIFPNKAFDEPFDGIVYAVMAGMGFAAFENIIYVQSGGIQVAILRMFTAIPAHAVFGVLMGYFMGLAKFDKKRQVQLMFTGVMAAVVAHGLYDFFLMQMNYEFLGGMAFTTLILSWVLGKKAMRIHREQSPFKPANAVEEVEAMK